jgi:polar amino acid transport system substrate-binding protein
VQSQQGAWCAQKRFHLHDRHEWSYKDASSLEGITIGVIKDYTYGDEIDNYIKKHEKDSKRVDIVSGDNPLDLNIKKVKAGRIAAFIEDEAVGDYTIAQRTLSGELKLAGCVKETPLFIAFGPKNPKSKEYAKILSDYVAKARKDGSLSKLLASYGLKDWSK